MKRLPRITMAPTSRELGGITILVCLFMLVLLTISAMAMSKNALREVIISGTTRQGADVRNIADTGLEWSICYMPDNDQRPAPVAGTDAAAFRDLMHTIGWDPNLQGVPQDFVRPLGGEMTIPSAAGVTKNFNLVLTTMGNIEMLGTQKDATKTLDAYNPATLQLWSLRSNAQADYSGGQTYIHSREAWLTLLPKSKPQ